MLTKRFASFSRPKNTQIFVRKGGPRCIVDRFMGSMNRFMNPMNRFMNRYTGAWTASWTGAPLRWTGAPWHDPVHRNPGPGSVWSDYICSFCGSFVINTAIMRNNSAVFMHAYSISSDPVTVMQEDGLLPLRLGVSLNYLWKIRARFFR